MTRPRLFDTHIIVWMFEGNERMPMTARTEVNRRDGPAYYSAASMWEIATKVRIGKLRLRGVSLLDLPAALAALQVEGLPVLPEHGLRAGLLPGDHRDPFDRMLAAQALALGAVLVSVDPVFDAWGVARIG
ncbi:MAG: type II toxin-antitoxin system VapC family toxin [Myxococcales bacterium]|nr:type II toxin-antitoxin system VapC family toxin [Myxococcales bacterium]